MIKNKRIFVEKLFLNLCARAFWWQTQW